MGTQTSLEVAENLGAIMIMQTRISGEGERSQGRKERTFRQVKLNLQGNLIYSNYIQMEEETKGIA